MEETKKINYKSDFDFIAKLTATNANGESMEVGFPDYDFELIITSGCNGYSTRSFVASSIGGVAKNCINDSGQLHIVCDNHKLNVGELFGEFKAYLPNDIYPDGTQLNVEPQSLGIELVVGASDTPTTAEIELQLPYIYQSAYDLAVASGYEGSMEDYMRLSAELPEAVETAKLVKLSADSLANSASSLSESATKVSEGANSIKESATTLENSATSINASAESLSQLPNAVEIATKVQASADSLADSAETIGGAIEALVTTTDAIEQGANVIKDNADTLQESANIVKKSAEQIGANIADLQSSVSSIDGAVEDINQGASTIANSATKVETSATTLEGVSATINGSATSLAESATAIAEGANTIKLSADTLQTNADKVSESATKVEQAVEPLVQASESLDATKQAFEMLSSEWADGRRAIATALTNRRYPTEPTESFHSMADKITNMSYEEGWFAKIGYTKDNDGGIQEAIDYSYELSKGWNPDGSTAQMFRENKILKFLPQLDTSSVTNMNYMFQSCSALTTIPQLDTSNVTSMSSMFYNCGRLRFILIKNLGKSTLATYDFSGATNWGVATTDIPDARQSLIDSLITYSHDRASNGMATVTIKLSANTKALLTEEEIAQITANGFTIS